MTKVRLLRGCLHMPGPQHSETTAQIGAFKFQAGTRDILIYEKDDVFAWTGDQAELDSLVARGVVTIVADDTPVTAGKQGEKQVLSPEPVFLKDGRRVEKTIDDKWIAAPPKS